jgi:hypothetical protein
MSKQQFNAGDRVNTPFGPGKVVYKRMAPPTYSQAEAYSVKLDEKADRIGYSGTMFSADDVESADCPHCGEEHDINPCHG